MAELATLVHQAGHWAHAARQSTNCVGNRQKPTSNNQPVAASDVQPRLVIHTRLRQIWLPSQHWYVIGRTPQGTAIKKLARQQAEGNQSPACRRFRSPATSGDIRRSAARSGCLAALAHHRAHAARACGQGVQSRNWQGTRRKLLITSLQQPQKSSHVW